MAWTAPRTWVTGEVITSAIMNQHIRDNFLETAPAKAQAAGDIFYATGPNAITRLPIAAEDGYVLTTSSGNLAWSAVAFSPLVFGSGKDGSVTLDGTVTVPWASKSGNIYTLTRDVELLNLTINSGITLQVNGYRILARGTITINNGIIESLPGSTSYTRSALGGSGMSGYEVAQNGGNGGSLTCALGGNGGNGGNAPNAYVGGSGGTVSNPTTEGWKLLPFVSLVFHAPQSLTIGGGAGGGGGAINTGIGSSGTSGSGGHGGGVIYIACNILSGVGTIRADGGNASSASGSGAGGGGGGGGGAIIIVRRSSTFSGTMSVSGGLGSAGSGGGSSGTNGSAGQVIHIAVP